MEQSAPEVRIVIPAFRAEATIRDCVAAIAVAAHGIPHEIVVVDDGGNTDLRTTLADLPATVRHTTTGGSAARARNLGAVGFAGRILVFIDADVIVAPDCLGRLVSPIRAGCANATVGNYMLDVTGLGFGASYKQVYVARIYARRSGYIQNDFWTAIGAVSTPVFHAVGGFDTDFAGANGEDAQFGRCLTGRSFRIQAVPEALGQHRHPLTVRKVVANDWRKGVVAMRDYLRSSETRLSDNKHATWRDMLAVLSMSTSVAVVALALILFNLTLFLAMLLPFGLYLIVRGDLTTCFALRGPWFMVRAVPLMATLDLVRAACAVGGMALHIVERRKALRARGPLVRHDTPLSLSDINTANER